MRTELLAEVVASYADTVIDVAHVRERYVIGEGPQANLTTTGDALGDADGLSIVRAEHGELWLDFTASMRGSLSTGGRERSLAALVEAGEARPEGGHFSVPLRPGAEARIELGDLQLRVRLVPFEPVAVGRASCDRPFLALLSATTAVGVALLGLLHLIPPEALALDHAQLYEPAPAYRIAMLVDEPVATQVAIETSEAELPESGSGAGTSKPALRGDSGAHGARRPGDRSSRPKPERIAASPRTQVTPLQSMRRDQPFNLDVASSSAGLVGVVGPYMKQFAEASSGAFSVAVDDHELWQSMTRDRADDLMYGVGGLGLIGTGSGGGGQHLEGLGLLDGGGERHRTVVPRCGRHCKRDREPVRWEPMPSLHIGEARVDGNLEVYEIRRVLRRHQDQLIACVAKLKLEPRRAPDVLVINFAIASNGAVATAVIDRTTFGDREIARCITRAFERWRFPASSTGEAVLVVHEFELSWKLVPVALR